MAKGNHWRNKEDLILVETLTEFVAKGISIHEAFPTVAERLASAGYERTDKACYSRWNNYLEAIYGKAIELAVRKQQENAQKIIESILENQSELQVIPQGESKVELLMPLYVPDTSVNPSRPVALQTVPSLPINPPPAMPEKIDNIQDGINFLINFQLKHESLQKDHNDLLEELEKTWEENEQLKLQVASFKEMEKKFEKLKVLASKLESVKL